MLRKAISICLALGLVIFGAAIVFGFLLQGGTYLMLVTGMTLAAIGFYWLKEDFARGRERQQKSGPPRQHAGP